MLQKDTGNSSTSLKCENFIHYYYADYFWKEIKFEGTLKLITVDELNRYISLLQKDTELDYWLHIFALKYLKT